MIDETKLRDTYIDLKEKPNFIFDEDKMNDFKKLNKDEFLTSYSYITEKEYDNTKIIAERIVKGKVTKFGNGGHIIFPKKYIGKKVKVII